MAKQIIQERIEAAKLAVETEVVNNLSLAELAESGLLNDYIIKDSVHFVSTIIEKCQREMANNLYIERTVRDVLNNSDDIQHSPLFTALNSTQQNAIIIAKMLLKCDVQRGEQYDYLVMQDHLTRETLGLVLSRSDQELTLLTLSRMDAGEPLGDVLPQLCTAVIGSEICTEVARQCPEFAKAQEVITNAIQTNNSELLAEIMNHLDAEGFANISARQEYGYSMSCYYIPQNTDICVEAIKNHPEVLKNPAIIKTIIATKNRELLDTVLPVLREQNCTDIFIDALTNDVLSSIIYKGEYTDICIAAIQARHEFAKAPEVMGAITATGNAQLSSVVESMLMYTTPLPDEHHSEEVDIAGEVHFDASHA